MYAAQSREDSGDVRAVPTFLRADRRKKQPIYPEWLPRERTRAKG